MKKDQHCTLNVAQYDVKKGHDENEPSAYHAKDMNIKVIANHINQIISNKDKRNIKESKESDGEMSINDSNQFNNGLKVSNKDIIAA